ncbi:MAG: hypothetical protein ACF8GE_03580 [Phycisphaerales bacterium JB043]
MARLLPILCVVTSLGVLSPLSVAQEGDASQKRPAEVLFDAWRTQPSMVGAVYFSWQESRAVSPEIYESLPVEAMPDAQAKRFPGHRYDRMQHVPLAYFCALDMVRELGVDMLDGMRITDSGFGSVENLHVLASAGADVVGIQTEGAMDGPVHARIELGQIPRAESVAEGDGGTLTIKTGTYPTSDEIIELAGGQIDLFVSKNSLRRGYFPAIPDPTPCRYFRGSASIIIGDDPYKDLPLCVTEFVPKDAEYLQTVYDALAPGGLFLVYNLYIDRGDREEMWVRPDGVGECQFDLEMVIRAGFEIISWNQDDSAHARTMQEALREYETGCRPSEEYSAMATILRKPG